MERYDPELAPDREEWLGIGELERILLVEAYHRDTRADLPKGSRRIHATIHVVVENQLAENHAPVVRALARLMKEGLSRHDAVHAIGSVVAESIYDIHHDQETKETVQPRYDAAIERLTAEEWRAKGDG